MKPKHVKKLLISEIESTAKSMCSYVISKETDFTRNRKLPFLTIIKSIIGMESKSLTNELIDIFPNVESLLSASAFETIERIFGTAKENHGFSYTQMYGKARMRMKVALTFACVNLKKLAKIQQEWELKMA